MSVPIASVPITSVPVRPLSRLGVDVSKKTLCCALMETPLDGQAQRVLWLKQFDNTPQGIRSLLHHAPVHTPLVVEPTGRYSLAVVEQARNAGRKVLLASPRKAKSFLRSTQSRAKTDKLDCQGLALYGLCQPLKEYLLKPTIVSQLDQLLSARKGISISITRLEAQARELPYAREALEAAMADLKERRKQLDKEIARLGESVPELEVVRRLKEVPGIGAVTAAAVGSRLAAKEFEHPDSFVAYIGLDIGVVQSGTKKGTTGLTHQGDAELRRLLYLAASASLRAKDSPFKRQYERELKKGLPKVAAICAVARKMAKLCWSLHRHGTRYTPERVYQQPKEDLGSKQVSHESEPKS